jgi:hypothetical protein
MRPEDLAMGPDIPRLSMSKRDIIPISLVLLTNNLLEIIITYNSWSLLEKERINMRRESIKERGISYLSLVGRIIVVWNLEPHIDSKRERIFSLSSKNHNMVVKRPISIIVVVRLRE